MFHLGALLLRLPPPKLADPLATEHQPRRRQPTGSLLPPSTLSLGQSFAVEKAPLLGGAHTLPQADGSHSSGGSNSASHHQPPGQQGPMLTSSSSSAASSDYGGAGGGLSALALGGGEGASSSNNPSVAISADGGLVGGGGGAGVPRGGAFDHHHAPGGCCVCSHVLGKTVTLCQSRRDAKTFPYLCEE